MKHRLRRSDVVLSHSDVLRRCFATVSSQSDVMCSASSRAKRTSLPKDTSRTMCASRSAGAEHIVPKTKALLAVPAIKQYFTSYQCKVLLYLFNNELIIEKKKNYAIIKS